jgi:Glycosyltransferase family 87
MNHGNCKKLFNYSAIILLGVTLGFYICFIQFKGMLVLTDKSSISHRIYNSVGEEFRLFWTASFMVLNGKLADIYNNSRFEEIEDSLTGSKSHHVWLYPPTFLLVVLPLSLLPYLASLAVWLAITLICYLLILRRICPQPLIFFWILLFPGITFNMMVGHNGFLSGILLGAGLLCSESSPVLAGIFFGLMFYKPQLAILIPVALFAGGRWKVLSISTLSALCIVIISVLIFGDRPWMGFLHNLLAGANLTDTPFFWKKMPTVYATARSAGSGTIQAWILQGLIMIGILSGVCWVWSGEATAVSRVSILVIGSLLFTPYAFIYDYAILAIPLAWLWQEGQTTGWLSWEKPLILGVWIMPLINLLVEYLFWLPMLSTMLALFILVLRRHSYELAKVRETTAVALSQPPNGVEIKDREESGTIKPDFPRPA